MSAPKLSENWQESLRSLEAGWDSYKGKPITAEAISALESFSVVPCGDGGLELVAYRDGIQFTLEIEPAGRIGFVLVSPSDDKRGL